jgi:hypothetical protein
MENYKYVVCALGYKEDGYPTDTEIFLEEFETSEPALKYARKVQTVEECLELAGETLDTVYGFHPERGDFLTLRVEQCIEMEPEDELDPEEGYTECVDVLYECDLTE